MQVLSVRFAAQILRRYKQGNKALERDSLYFFLRFATALNYEVISEAVCSVRACKPLSADWKKRIDEDVKKRGK